MKDSPTFSEFCARHIGPRPDDIKAMLTSCEFASLDALISAAVPASVRCDQIDYAPGVSEQSALAELKTMMSKNRVVKSLIGQGYYGCHVPGVILRNVLQNPGWYTQYTAYQSEISQGRLEALLNFQTMVSDLTGLPVANASLLDEGTAAAEGMAMCFASTKGRNKFFIADGCFAQTRSVVETRAAPLGLAIETGSTAKFTPNDSYCGILLQNPGAEGQIQDLTKMIESCHKHGMLVVVAVDPLSLMVMKSPGSMGADIAVGSAQRFGVPMGFGGPHAGFMATSDELMRRMPGRIVGVSKDSEGRPAYRLSLQTREQHIRRDKATSNICTAQALLAIMSSMYAVYHGPDGLRRIATRVHGMASLFAEALKAGGVKCTTDAFFDTIRVENVDAPALAKRAEAAGFNIHTVTPRMVSVCFDETTTEDDVAKVATLFGAALAKRPDLGAKSQQDLARIPAGLRRSGGVLTHPVFNRYHSETEMLRYIRRLEARDLSLGEAMIPLGSCTMKLNATSELEPITWPEVNQIHPMAPEEQTRGYVELVRQLADMLTRLTGFDAFSLQPNSGAQGELAGLLVIRKFQESQKQGARHVCLVPSSAHGTNPASAAIAGMKIVVIQCDSSGNIDIQDLESKARLHKADLSALMVTYPSTHGVFEESLPTICRIVHENGGQVYMDGANLNALIGISQPGKIGPDVCHVNLHKTFCIPHGGGGPGMGPIGVKSHLARFLPRGPLDAENGAATGPIAAAKYGSASILPISWMYIRMMGAEGLRRATQVAILNANYIAKRINSAFPVLYRGSSGLVAHECIIDARRFKASAGIEIEDIAKRLMDYGFHAPTVSWPVAGTMMIEPTESESKEEIDRFCDALIAIHAEITEIEAGRMPRDNNLLKNAPHTLRRLTANTWDAPYTRERAAFPVPGLRDGKFWPSVSRIDNTYGDRNLVCTCPPVESYS